MAYILFFIIYLEEEFFFKDLYWIYKLKDRMGKINNSFKIPRKKTQTL